MIVDYSEQINEQNLYLIEKGSEIQDIKNELEKLKELNKFLESDNNYLKFGNNLFDFDAFLFGALSATLLLGFIMFGTLFFWAW
jgi:hypothetical protein